MPYYSHKFNHLEDNMGFKIMDNSLGFADFALASSLEHNRSLKLMVKLDKSIEWSRIESILMGHYTIGTSGEGAMLIPRCYFLNACCFKSGFASSLTLNWRTKSMTGCPLKSSSACHSANPLPTIQRSLVSEIAYLKRPWTKSTPKSYDNLRQRV